MLSFSLPVFVLLVVALLLFLMHRRRRNSRLPYPPGPKGLPVVGNTFDVPQDVPLWKAAMSIGANYSESVVLAPLLRCADVGVVRF